MTPKNPTPEPSPERFSAHARARAQDAQRAERGRGRLLLLGGVAIGLAAAAAVVAAVVVHRAPPPPAVAPRVALVPFAAQVDLIAPAPQEGLFLRLPGAPAERAAGLLTRALAGSRLRTDERTEARVRLSDGSVVVLGRDTEVELVATASRSMRLLHGSLRADVAHRADAPPAEFLGVHGVVRVLGTRFTVTEGVDRTSVEVERGRVALRTKGEPVEIGEGQEGVADASGTIRLFARTEHGGDGWLDDETADDDAAEGETIPGLGELRAHRPGERAEQERPLALAEHRVSVKIAGTIARTEVEEAFRNDDDATLEGIYRFPLPDGARIASLELEVDGRFERGAFVDRERGQQIFRGVVRHATPVRERQQREEIVWVPGPWRDPALLEQQRGGRFELRIFPIPAHGARRIRIAYEQDVAPRGDARRYVYPLPSVRRGDARVGAFHVDVEVTGQDAARGVRAGGYAMRTDGSQPGSRLVFDATAFAPSGDLLIEYGLAGGEAALRYAQYRGDAVVAAPVNARVPTETALASSALAADERGYVVFTLRPELPFGAAMRPTDYAIVVDSSQSMRGERYRRAVRIAERLVTGLDRRHRAVVVACDLGCRVHPSGLDVPSAELARSAAEFLATITPAGSSNPVASFASAARSLPASEGRSRMILYVGDGVASSGPVSAGPIAREVEAFANASGVSVSTIGVGSDADGVALAAVARAAGGHYVPSVAGQSAADTATAMLDATSGPSLEQPVLELPAGLEDVAPARLPTMRPGLEVKVAARLRGAIHGELVLRGKLAGRAYERRYPVSLADDHADRNTFVPRAWANARIADLEADPADHHATIAALSESYGVVSQATSLIVLESEAMFQAYGLDRASGPLAWNGTEGVDETTVGELVDGPSDIDLPATGGTGDSLASAAGEARRGRAMADDAMPSASIRGMGAGSTRPAAAPMGANAASEAAAPPSPPMRPRGPGSYMRRVAYREPSVSGSRGPSARDLDALAVAKAALAAEPDHRDRVIALVRAAFRAGRTDEVEKALAAWLERDPADVDAITLASDVAHERGHVEEAVRILSGLADLAPNDPALQQRLVDAFERRGDAEHACMHRVAMSASTAADAAALERAADCARTLGLAATEQAIRARTAALAGRIDTPARSLTDVRGELVLDARFAGGDVDLVLVTPRGERISWLGGRRDVTARDVRSADAESLGLRSARLGSYRIEVVRADGGGRSVRGTVRVRVLGLVRELPFALDGESAVVGRIEVAQRFRMVPL